MRYDEALEVVGPFGRYQMLMFFLLSSTSMKAAFDVELLVLQTYTPKFWCSQPGNLSVSNSTEGACVVPDSNSTPCTAWTYDDSELKSTIVTEFDLVCDSAYKVPIMQSIVFLGTIFGMLSATLGDRFGRYKVILIQGIYDLVMTALVAVVPGLQAQIAFRFFRSFGNGMYCQGLCLIVELVGNRYRGALGCNYWIPWCLGYAGSALLGKYIQYWRFIQLSSCLIAPIYIAVFLVAYESPRWLVVKGRKKEAAAVLERIARWNGRSHVTAEQFDDICVDDHVATGRFRDAFSSRVMAMKTVACWMILWSFSFSYYGVSIDSKFASDDIFLNMALLGLMEIPSSLIGWVVGDKFGRRIPTLLMLFVSAAIILAVPHLPKGELAWVKVTVGALGKFILTTAYVIGIVYITELMPTCIRNVGYFSSWTFNCLGCIVAPQVLHFARVTDWGPSIFFGGQCIIGALVFIPLPETVGLPMPQTVQEANQLVLGKEREFKRRLNELHGEEDDAALPLAKEDSVENGMQLQRRS